MFWCVPVFLQTGNQYHKCKLDTLPTCIFSIVCFGISVSFCEVCNPFIIYQYNCLLIIFLQTHCFPVCVQRFYAHFMSISFVWVFKCEEKLFQKWNIDFKMKWSFFLKICKVHNCQVHYARNTTVEEFCRLICCPSSTWQLSTSTNKTAKYRIQ